MHENTACEEEDDLGLPLGQTADGSLPVQLDIFDAWRCPRAGTDNPSRMDNPVWDWLVRSGISAYEASRRYGIDDVHPQGPNWCFERFGRTSTTMPDGRIIHIGGEHEDHYDPDFHIYNDVIAVDVDGGISIFGYSREVFPPTDFHTATLVGDDLYIIGRLGYPEDRRSRIESVHVLDTGTYRFRTLPTRGDAPPWLHQHMAEADLLRRVIRVTEGIHYREDVPVAIENFGTWELEIDTGTWSLAEMKPWSQWCFRRETTGHNALWNIRQMLWTASVGWVEEHRQDRERLIPMLGPGAEPERIESLYSVPIPHAALESRDDEHAVHRIVVEGVTVRYVEGMFALAMTVEGELPDEVIGVLVEDLRGKLSKIEGHAYRVERIPHSSHADARGGIWHDGAFPAIHAETASCRISKMHSCNVRTAARRSRSSSTARSTTSSTSKTAACAADPSCFPSSPRMVR